MGLEWSLSKEHAVIEVVDADNHLLYDLGSRNKTRLGKMVLQPDVRYQLADGAKIHLADVSAMYRRLPNGPEEDSGSETGSDCSESMLNMNDTADDSIIPETPGPSKIQQKKTIEESPSSVSGPDSPFGDKQKELFVKPNSLMDQSAKGDSIFDAKTLRVLELSKDESIYEADTQYEEAEKSQLTQGDDIYDAPTQRFLNETTKVSKPVAKDLDKMEDAPTQRLFDNQSKPGADTTDATSSCSERTEDYTIEENSSSSNEDVTNKTEEGGNTTCIKVKEDGKSSTDDKLNASQNDDSYDRSMLEGDDDFFDFEATQIHGKNINKSDKKPKDQAPSSSTDKSDDPKRDSDQIKTSMNYSRRSDDMFFSQPLNSSLNKSLKTSSLKTNNDPITSVQAAQSKDSGDENDPENIFDAPTQPLFRLQKDTKLPLNNGNKSSVEGNDETESEIDDSKPPPSAASEAKKSFAEPNVAGNGSNDKDKPSMESKKAEDISEAATQMIESPKKTENKSPTKVATVENSEKRKDVPKTTDISEKNKAGDKPKEFSKSPENGNKSKELPQASAAAQDIDDDIFDAPTQVIGTPSKSALPSGKSPEKNKISPPSSSDAKKLVPEISPARKEAVTQKTEVPTKVTDTTVAYAAVNSSKPTAVSPSNHVNSKAQDGGFKTPAKSKEQENKSVSLQKAPAEGSDVPMKATSKDDIFDAATQKIDEKLPEIDQKTDLMKAELKKDNENNQCSSTDSKAQSSPRKDTKDIYDADTQDIFDADTQIVDDYEKTEQKDSVAKVEEAKSDEKSTKSGETSGSALKTQEVSDTSPAQDSKKTDSKSPSVRTTEPLKGTGDNSETHKEKLPELVTKSPELSNKPQTELLKLQGVEESASKSESVPSTSSPPLKTSSKPGTVAPSASKVNAETEVVSKKTEEKVCIGEPKAKEDPLLKSSEVSSSKAEGKDDKNELLEKKELEDSGKKPEEDVTEKSRENNSTEKPVKSSPVKDIHKAPNNKDGVAETSIAAKEGDKKTPWGHRDIDEDFFDAPTQIIGMHGADDGKSDVNKATNGDESECAAEEGKFEEQREEIKEGKDDEEKEKDSSSKEKELERKDEKLLKQTDTSEVNSTKTASEVILIKSDSDNENLHTRSKEVKVDDSQDDVERSGFRTPPKKGKLNEDAAEGASPSCLDDSMELLLPGTQELIDLKNKQVTTSELDVEIEDISSCDEASSPIVASEHLPIKRARVRKRFNMKLYEEEKATASSRTRNSPAKKSTASENSADASSTRPSRRRKQPEEPAESGVPGGKQRKVSEEDSSENVKIEEPHRSDEAVTEKSETSQTSTKRPRRGASTSNDGSAKQASKIPTRERSSRNKNEKAEETNENAVSRKSGGQRASGRRGPEQTGAQGQKERQSGRRAKKIEDEENSPATTSRPSRQRKMTWKVRESLSDNSQGSSNFEDDKPKSRSRGGSSNNSQSGNSQEMLAGRTSRSRTSTPLRKEAEKPSPKPSTPRKSASSGTSAEATPRSLKRKIQEAQVETPVKRSRREEQSESGDAKEPETRISGRRSKNTAGLVVTQPEVSNSRASRSTRRKKETPVASPSCLKELNTSTGSSSSTRQQRGTKRANTTIEKEVPPAKQQKQEKKVLQETLKEMSPVVGRSSRSRGKRSAPPQAQDATESSIPAQTQRMSRSSKMEDEKEDKTETPTPKTAGARRSKATRGKGTPQSNVNVEESSPRRATSRKTATATRMAHQVMFTGFSDTKQEAIVKQLGGSVVDTPDSCTVLVTDKVRRTYKFLCIVGRGKPIVSPEWLVQCRRSGSFIDPWQYVVKDQESETKYKFHLQDSLELAARTKLLEGYSVHVTAKVKPPPSEMKGKTTSKFEVNLVMMLYGHTGIIENSGGTFLAQAPAKSWPANSFSISCPEDISSWSKLKKSGKPVVGPEVLLLGVLQQKLDLKSNTLV
ncbi:hypothetical protein C0J52_16279 [Blattella germanica]|nr:hypothetical protein C0J52_16279 [Blattella germanica]